VACLAAIADFFVTFSSRPELSYSVRGDEKGLGLPFPKKNEVAFALKRLPLTVKVKSKDFCLIADICYIDGMEAGPQQG